MTDTDLLILGCAVSFIVVSGAYVFLRERYENRSRSEVEVVHSNPRRKTGRNAA